MMIQYFHDSPYIVIILAPGRYFFYQMCPISFNIYGIKLNERHFSFVTNLTHLCDKFYQEINFKSHS